MLSFLLPYTLVILFKILFFKKKIRWRRYGNGYKKVNLTNGKFSFFGKWLKNRSKYYFWIHGSTFFVDPLPPRKMEKWVTMLSKNGKFLKKKSIFKKKMGYHNFFFQKFIFSHHDHKNIFLFFIFRIISFFNEITIFFICFINTYWQNKKSIF